MEEAGSDDADSASEDGRIDGSGTESLDACGPAGDGWVWKGIRLVISDASN